MGHIFAKRIKLSGGHYTVTLPVATTIKPGVHVTFAIITHEKIPATGNRRRNFSHFPFGVELVSRRRKCITQLPTFDFNGWMDARKFHSTKRV